MYTLWGAERVSSSWQNCFCQLYVSSTVILLLLLLSCRLSCVGRLLLLALADVKWRGLCSSAKEMKENNKEILLSEGMSYQKYKNYYVSLYIISPYSFNPE